MNVGSLFAGIGGFDLAARWMGWRTAWFSETDPYASAVLAKHWPGVPNHGDIRNIDGRRLEPVDILCGGFPCQDISLAGKGAGISGERSGLWTEYARLIGEIRPRYVVVENVSALLARGLDVVLGDLAEIGYDAEWHCLPASYVGAPHRRDRVWIIAYASGGQLRLESGRSGGTSGAAASFFGANGEAESVADADNQGQLQPQGCIADIRGWSSYSGWWELEPDVGRVAARVPARVDRLRCLGNAIVPQAALLIFQAIEAREGMTT